MLARPKWRPPRNVIEEIKLARDLAERDDDVAPAMQSMISAAIADGYQNQHPDEQVQHTFDKMTEDMGLPRSWRRCTASG
jgi:DNA-binding protein YbaB